jgi:hypothetical protein
MRQLQAEGRAAREAQKPVAPPTVEAATPVTVEPGTPTGWNFHPRGTLVREGAPGKPDWYGGDWFLHGNVETQETDGASRPDFVLLPCEHDNYFFCPSCGPRTNSTGAHHGEKP